MGTILEKSREREAEQAGEGVRSEKNAVGGRELAGGGERDGALVHEEKGSSAKEGILGRRILTWGAPEEGRSEGGGRSPSRGETLTS